MTSLKRGNWSTHELERLRVLYPRAREESVARLLRRSVPSVQRKAQELFSMPAPAREWTAGDDLRLREGYGVLDLEALSLVLGRSTVDVAGRIAHTRSNLHTEWRWSRVEIAMLKRLYGSRRDEDLVVCLSRPIGQIRARAASLCLSKDKAFLAKAGTVRQTMPRWGEPDVRLLRELYPSISNLELARRLNRSVASVANKANQLGLRKAPDVLEEMGRRNVSARYRGAD